MKISIVVPAFNEEKVLARSLAAITEASGAFRGRGWETEIVVCDNNSTDRTPEIARAAGARVVFEPVNQISRARNKGGFAADGGWLIFVDADSFPSPALFDRVAGQIESGRCVGGGCLIEMDGRVPGSDLLVRLWNLISRVRRWAAGSFIFCDAAVFRELNGFSEALYASEEIDFCKRLNRAGRRLKRRVVIITDVRMLTSARKLSLYRRDEHFRFFLRFLFSPRRVLASRELCHTWYDGRR